MNKRLQKAVAHAKALDPNKDTNRLYNVLRGYGLTEADYLALIDKQGAGCAICGRVAGSGKDSTSKNFRYLCVDHDHDTGKVRGLLCSNCNTGLGMFRDNVELLRLATAYLERHRI